MHPVRAEVHRRSLPIAAPCRVFDPTAEKSFCDHCSTQVHDLSAMTKREAAQLISSNVGKNICVAYRTATDGTLLHRPEPRPLGRAAGSLMALGLAACAAHAPESEHPGEGCRDPQGYEVDCEPLGPDDEPQIPDADPLVAEHPELEQTETTPDDVVVTVEVPQIGEPVDSPRRAVGIILVQTEAAPIEESPKVRRAERRARRSK